MDQIKAINEYLRPYRVQVWFSKESLDDLNTYDKNQQELIVALILKRAKNGPLLKPFGIGKPLRNKLKGFTKIKAKSMALRIVYRPVKLGEDVRMELIAIGPRDKQKVYLLAAKRLQSFNEQVE